MREPHGFMPASGNWLGALQQTPSAWPWPMQGVAALLTATLVLLLAWLTVLRSQPEERGKEQVRQTQLQQQYRERLQAVAALPALRAQVAVMEQQQHAHPALKPAPANVQGLLAALHRAGGTQGLHMEQLQPGKEKKMDRQARQMLGFRVRGEYPAMEGFLRALPDLPQAVVPERWTLAANRSVARRGEGSLVLQGKLAAYRFTEASEKGTHKRSKRNGDKQ